MSDELRTTSLHMLLDRMQAGERAAQNELIRRIALHMEHLCRNMLKRFERLRQLHDTGDVLTNACMRLLRSLHELKPASTREFFALAAEQVRRELLDLAKYHDRDRRAGAAHALSLNAPADTSAAPVQASADEEHPAELERWAAFHDAIPQLPVAEREVFGLLFYHGWKQQEVAALLHCDERTVRRRWHRACLLLKEALGGEMPDL